MKYVNNNTTSPTPQLLSQMCLYTTAIYLSEKLAFLILHH